MKYVFFAYIIMIAMAGYSVVQANTETSAGGITDDTGVMESYDAAIKAEIQQQL